MRRFRLSAATMFSPSPRLSTARTIPCMKMRLVFPTTERSPPQTTYGRGWAALCFDNDTNCIDLMERTAARAYQYVRSEFVLESTLLGQPGATQGFTALIVPPSIERTITPSPATGVAEDFGAIARTRRQID